MKRLLSCVLVLLIFAAPVLAYTTACDRAITSNWHDRGSVVACLMEIMAAIENGGDWNFPGDGDDTAGSPRSHQR